MNYTTMRTLADSTIRPLVPPLSLVRVAFGTGDSAAVQADRDHQGFAIRLFWHAVTNPWTLRVIYATVDIHGDGATIDLANCFTWLMLVPAS